MKRVSAGAVDTRGREPFDLSSEQFSRLLRCCSPERGNYWLSLAASLQNWRSNMLPLLIPVEEFAVVLVARAEFVLHYPCSRARGDMVRWARQPVHVTGGGRQSRVFSTDALSAGENWEPKLRDEIAQSDVFMVLLSPASVASKWVLHELGAAWVLRKPIIPVLTRPESPTRVPIELRDREVVELDGLDSPEAIAQLLEPYA